MTIERILAICKAYDRLGGAVQEQLDDVLQDRIEDCNPNAVRLLRRFINEVKDHADVNGDDELEDHAETILVEIDAFLKG